MTYVRPIASLCIAFATLLVSVVAQAETVVLNIPSATPLKVQVPKGWEETTTEATKELPVARMKLHSDKDKSVTIQISFLEDKVGNLTDQKSIDQFVASASGEQYREASVEKQVNVVQMKSKNLLGAYAQFTDASLANTKDVKPPQYRNVTSATLVIGKTIAAVTILSNSTDTPAYKAAMQFLNEDIQKH